MKTLKKILCTITVLVLMVPFAGCPMQEEKGKKAEPEQKKELTVTELCIENNTNNVKTFIEQSVKTSFAAADIENIGVGVFARGNTIDVVVELKDVAIENVEEQVRFLLQEMTASSAENLKNDFLPVKQYINELESINFVVAANGGLTFDEQTQMPIAPNLEMFLAKAEIVFE